MSSRDLASISEAVPMSMAPLQHEPSRGSWLETNGESPSWKGTLKFDRRHGSQTSAAPHRVSALLRYPAPRPPPMGPLPPLPSCPPRPPRRPNQYHVVSNSVSSCASTGSSSSGSASGSSGTSDAFLSPVTPPKAVVWQTAALVPSETDWGSDEWAPDDPFELDPNDSYHFSDPQTVKQKSRTSTHVMGSSRTSQLYVTDRLPTTRLARTPEDALGLDRALLDLFPSPPARPVLRSPTWQQMRHTSGGTVLPPRSSSLASSSLSLALRPPSMSFSRIKLARESVDDDGQTIMIRSERSDSGSRGFDCRWRGTFEDVFLVGGGRHHPPEPDIGMSEADKIRAAYLAGRV